MAQVNHMNLNIYNEYSELSLGKLFIVIFNSKSIFSSTIINNLNNVDPDFFIAALKTNGWIVKILAKHLVIHHPTTPGTLCHTLNPNDKKVKNFEFILHIEPEEVLISFTNISFKICFDINKTPESTIDKIIALYTSLNKTN